MHVVILGCGYTGTRVASRFLARGARVTATTREPGRLAGLGVEAVRFEDVHVPAGALLLHSIPPDGPHQLFEKLGSAPARVVYLSSTGVYGNASVVNESTEVDPAHPRVAVEQRVMAGPWSWLVLRPAAIYGPGRGVHESIRTGVCRLGDEFVSRIHVEDLAAHCEAALLSDVTGAFPVADEEPCTATAITEFCARLLGLPMPAPHAKARASRGRRVDGSTIRRLLGITLTYPGYRVGIPVSLK